MLWCNALRYLPSRWLRLPRKGSCESVCLFDSSYSFSFFPNSSSISCISPSLPFSFRQYRQAIGLLAQTRQTVPSERLVAGASESDEELVNRCSNTCYSARKIELLLSFLHTLSATPPWVSNTGAGCTAAIQGTAF